MFTPQGPQLPLSGTWLNNMGLSCIWTQSTGTFATPGGVYCKLQRPVLHWTYLQHTWDWAVPGHAWTTGAFTAAGRVYITGAWATPGCVYSRRAWAALDVSTPQEVPGLHLELIVWATGAFLLLGLSTSLGPELHLDASIPKGPELHLDASIPQGPELHLELIV